jgi:hypothetical protein
MSGTGAIRPVAKPRFFRVSVGVRETARDKLYDLVCMDGLTLFRHASPSGVRNIARGERYGSTEHMAVAGTARYVERHGAALRASHLAAMPRGCCRPGGADVVSIPRRVGMAFSSPARRWTQ